MPLGLSPFPVTRRCMQTPAIVTPLSVNESPAPASTPVLTSPDPSNTTTDKKSHAFDSDTGSRDNHGGDDDGAANTGLKVGGSCGMDGVRHGGGGDGIPGRGKGTVHEIEAVPSVAWDSPPPAQSPRPTVLPSPAAPVASVASPSKVAVESVTPISPAPQPTPSETSEDSAVACRREVMRARDGVGKEGRDVRHHQQQLARRSSLRSARTRLDGAEAAVVSAAVGARNGETHGTLSSTSDDARGVQTRPIVVGEQGVDCVVVEDGADGGRPDG